MFLFVVIVLTSTQIVKADDGPKGHGFLKPTLRGALEPAEFKNAMTVLFDGSSDAKIAEYFQTIKGFSFDDMKKVYKHHIEELFGVSNVTDEEMLKIINKTEFREAEKDHWQRSESAYIPEGAKSYSDIDWWSPSSVRNNEFIGSIALGNGPRKDWITTFCANADRLKERQTVVKPAEPKVEKSEKEYTYIPGKTTIIEHGIDSTIEKFYFYNGVEKNFFQNNINNAVSVTKNNSQSYSVDMKERAVERQVDDHYEEASYKEETKECKQPSSCNHKKVKNKNGFWTHLLAFGAGVVTGAVLENNTNVNLGRRNVPSGRIITQAPVELLRSTVPIFQ